MAYATGNADARWPDGVIPYVISDEFSEGQRREVLRAIDHWNDRTIIRLRRRFNEADSVAPGGDLVVWQVGLPAGGSEIRARGLDREGRDRFPELVVSAGPDGGAIGVPAWG